MTPVDKIRENRLRAAAARRGWALRKSRRRDINAPDYGTFTVVEIATGATVETGVVGLDGLDEWLDRPARPADRATARAQVDRLLSTYAKPGARPPSPGALALVCAACSRHITWVHPPLPSAPVVCASHGGVRASD